MVVWTEREHGRDSSSGSGWVGQMDSLKIWLYWYISLPYLFCFFLPFSFVSLFLSPLFSINFLGMQYYVRDGGSVDVFKLLLWRTEKDEGEEGEMRTGMGKWGKGAREREGTAGW